MVSPNSISLLEKRKPLSWIVYILECADKTLYTGITNNLEHRLQAHANGKGAKYTRGRGPFSVLYTETHPTMSQALLREAQLKKFDRRAKHTFIATYTQSVKKRQWTLNEEDHTPTGEERFSADTKPECE
jgi:putative endonuclease